MRNLAAEFNKDDFDVSTRDAKFFTLLGLYDIPQYKADDSTPPSVSPFLRCDSGSIIVTRKENGVDNPTVDDTGTLDTTRARTFYVLSCSKCYSGWVQ